MTIVVEPALVEATSSPRVAWLRRLDLSLVRHVSLLVGLYYLSALLPERLAPSAPDRFLQPVLAIEWLRQEHAGWTLAVLAVIAILGWRGLRWDRLEEGRLLRLFMSIVAGGLAWDYVTYEMNAYAGQWHLADRVLLASLALLVTVHPLFVVPFLFHLRTIAQQFGGLIGAYSFTDKQIAFDALWVFSLFLLCRLMVRTPARVPILLISSMLGSHFLFSMWSKVRLDWLTEERLDFLLTSSYANGWLGNVSPSTIAVLAALAVATAPAAKAMVVFSELSPIALFLNRRAFLIIIAGALALHLGVLAVAGLLFWKWMLVEAGLFLIVLRCGPEMRVSLFTPTTRVLSVVLMLGAPLYFRPAELGWLDTAITHTYELEAVGRSGRVYPVSRGFMAPFDLVVSQNQFEYLVDRKAAVTTYGATSNPEVARAINALVDSGADLATGLAEIEERYGVNRYSADTTASFDRFMQRYFGTLNRRGSKGRPRLAAPHHIWNAAPPGAYDMQEPVTEIRMRRRTLAWIPSRRQHSAVHDTIVRRVAIH